MNIREAKESDIPQIVKLLKLSLGESLMPKSDAYWRWKHIENPFGKSPVLLAEDNGKLIGVRAFMRWEWKKGDRILKAVRAVDTATHPDYQGRGVFKKLTLQLVEKCKAEGTDLIFNTPNQSSLPGYLKMGWIVAGDLPVSIGINKPVRVIKSIVSRKNTTEFLKIDKYGFQVAEDLEMSFKINEWRTNYSTKYIKWRYKEIPIIKYYTISGPNTFVIFRMIHGSKGIELRIVDIIGEHSSLTKSLKKLSNAISYDFISIGSKFQKQLPSFFKKRFAGPKVTLNALNYMGNEFIDFKNWSPTLGDLEVF